LRNFFSLPNLQTKLYFSHHHHHHHHEDYLQNSFFSPLSLSLSISSS
jgi:hypothetical protein